jgi:UPF0755 protein
VKAPAHFTRTLGLAALVTLTMGCDGGDSPPEMVEFTVPSGAAFGEVVDTLVARDLVGHPRLFRAFARVRGHDRAVRSGRYRVAVDVGWSNLLGALVEGRVLTEAVTIPEGFTLRQIVPRLAAITLLEPEEVERRLAAEGLEERLGVPGPGLEGYLFPDTYHFAPGLPLDSVLRTLVARYRANWTPDRVARREELGMTERELMTLASIVQAEARRNEEMPTISAVFHNRLRIGYPLQADPTVQYALGNRRSRLLYADIEAVADHPYNTYTHPGLPPGPIGAAGERAVDATLHPAEVDYLYFVARPDGTHIFTRSLAEHNRARVEARRQWDELQRRQRMERGSQ